MVLTTDIIQIPELPEWILKKKDISQDLTNSMNCSKQYPLVKFMAVIKICPPSPLSTQTF